MLLIGCSSNAPRQELYEVESTAVVESAPKVIIHKVPVNIKEKCKEPNLSVYYQRIKKNESMLEFFNDYKASYRICIAEITEWAK